MILSDVNIIHRNEIDVDIVLGKGDFRGGEWICAFVVHFDNTLPSDERWAEIKDDVCFYYRSLGDFTTVTARARLRCSRGLQGDEFFTRAYLWRRSARQQCDLAWATMLTAKPVLARGPV